MKIAILGNTNSEKHTNREELIALLNERGAKVFLLGVKGKYIDPYYCNKTAEFIPIKASRNNTNPLVEIISIFSVKKQVEKNHINSVIIYGVKNHAAMAIGSKLGGAIKILCVVNGSGNLFRLSGIKGGLLRLMSFPMLRIAYGLSSSICFQNIDDKELFIDKHLIKDNKKVFLTAGSGTNLIKFPFQKLPDENRFLFLSRITYSKGVVEYIRAAEIVKKKYPNVIFDIVGPLDATVERTVDSILKKACDNSVVKYHGATSDVSEWMGKCRYFIYPSYYPEGVPRCAIQAIATGRPIITCDTPGCKETVKDGINGFMIPARNYEILADKMIWMLEHPTQVANMAVESRRYAEDKFDVDKINEVLLNKLQ